MPKAMAIRNRRTEGRSKWTRYSLITGAVLVGIIIIVCSAVLARGRSNKVSYRGDMMIKAFAESEEDRSFLRNFSQLHIDAEVWGVPTDLRLPVFIYVQSGAFPLVEEVLKHQNITFNVLYSDLQSLIDEEAREMSVRKAERGGGDDDDDAFDLGNYHDYDELMNELQRLSNSSDLVRVTSLGQSHEGRELSLVSISGNWSTQRPVIFLHCGLHAREWISPAVCMSFIHRLVNATDDDSDAAVLDTFEWWLMPLGNPDGYAYTWTNDRMWRKNRAPANGTGGCTGVDLNRNFDADLDAASTDPCSAVYGGAEAFSEPETLALVDLLASQRHRLLAVVFLRSFGQLWLSPFAVNDSRPADYAEMERVMERSVLALTDTNGAEYRFGSIGSILYPSSGTAIDYCYETLGVVYSFSIQLRDQGNRGFCLPIAQIEDTALETWNGIRGMALAIQGKP